ncbi:SDR family NAD(P)-dependent oxidoreductase [Nocardioides endophyticus]
MKIAFVTGGNRGIGLASARRLAHDCGHVVITSRDAAAGEDAADRLRREGYAVTSLQMDVTDETSVKIAAGIVGGSWGTGSGTSSCSSTTPVNVSTTMGSLADQTNPDSPYLSLVVPAYQSSKAALNNVTITLAKQLAVSSIKVTSVCPRFVRTDLAPAAAEAPLAPEDAAEVVYRAATLPDSAASGTFVDAQGAVPW